MFLSYLVLMLPTKLLVLLAPLAFYVSGQDTARDTGVSGLWILANISYAGMRAQDSPNSVWRVVAFIFGFPGTLISLFAITEGSERAYGIDIPKRELRQTETPSSANPLPYRAALPPFRTQIASPPRACQSQGSRCTYPVRLEIGEHTSELQSHSFISYA